MRTPICIYDRFTVSFICGYQSRSHDDVFSIHFFNQEENGGSVHPKGKFFVSPDSLPVVTFHPDSKTDLYNSVPETSGSHTMPSSPNATSD